MATARTAQESHNPAEKQNPIANVGREVFKIGRAISLSGTLSYEPHRGLFANPVVFSTSPTPRLGWKNAVIGWESVCPR
jgi:hypothetical protein